MRMKIKKIVRKIREFIVLGHATKRHYYVEGKEVSEEVWYINDGLKLEEQLAEAVALLKEGKRDKLTFWV